MGYVEYTGASDRYELSASDLRKLGVEEGKKTVIEKDVATEVDDAVLDVLVNDPRLAGQFKEVDAAKAEELPDAEDEQESTGIARGVTSQTGAAADPGVTTAGAGRRARGSTGTGRSGRGSTAGSTRT